MKKLKDIKWKELILKNFGLKIIAVILAIVIWIVIVNVDNPSERKTISGIEVELLNEESVEESGYIYQVEDGATVSVVVKAPKEIVDELSASDFYAYADLSEASVEHKKARIHIQCLKEELVDSITIVNQKSDYVTLSIDTEISKEFSVDTEITGTPAKGYVMGNYLASPTSIKVSGASGVINSIKNVKIVYSIDNMNSDVEDLVSPIFYDDSGKEIDVSNLKLSRNTIKLSIEIFPSKTIPINYTVAGTAAEGFRCTSLIANTEEITIAAPSNILREIESVTIPDGILDITDLKEDKVFEVELYELLPSYVKIVKPSATFTLTAKVSKYIDMTVALNTGDINMKGTSDSYEYEIKAQDIAVTINGLESNVKSISKSELAPSINLSGKTEGTHTIKIEFASSDDYVVSGSHYVTVEIKNKEVEPPTEETTTSVEETT